jgi:hypothetical protein
MTTSEKAPEGYIWICAASGKTSPTRDGWDGDKFVGERGWDVSCFMGAQLVTQEFANKCRNDAHGN